MDSLVVAYPETFIAIRYNVSWPSGEDPFYLANAEESNARVDYYPEDAVEGYWYVPRLFLDGLIDADGSDGFGDWPDMVADRAQVESPVEITLKPHYYGTITANITATGPIAQTDLVTHFVIVENNLHFEAPNGILEHNQTMRDMCPDARGIPLTIQEGQTVDVTTQYNLQPDWVTDNCNMVVFVQSEITYEIFQAAQCKVYDVVLEDFTLDDSEGNGNGRPDPGETVNLVVSIENKGPDATDISGHLSSTDPSLTFLNADADYFDIPAWSGGDNSGNPFSFTVDESAEPHYAHFELLLQLNGGIDSDVISFTITVGHPAVLLVDDASPDVENQAYYKEPLDRAEGVIDIWSTAQSGSPESSWLGTYEIVVWFIAGTDATLSPEEQSHLSAYLESGGKLFISGENIAGDLESSPFLSDYLHAELVSDNSGDLLLTGVQGDMISGAVSLISIGGVAGVNTEPDVIAPLSGAMPVFNYNATGQPAAIRYGGDYKVVYLAFGFEGIIDFYDAPNSPALRADLMGNIMDYLRLEFTPQVGDVNEDGNVDILDVVWIVNIILGTHDPTTGQSWAADVTGDGGVDIVDAVVLVNIILGG